MHEGGCVVNLSEAEQVLDQLSAKPLTIQASHCVRVRNRHAQCSECTAHCPTQAITIENNQLALDPERCTHCGACANRCPTQALATNAINHTDWETRAYNLANTNTPICWVCCETHPLAREEVAGLVVLPCLAHLDEVHYLLMAYYGIDLHVLNGECASCTNASVASLIEQTEASARAIASALNLPFTAHFEGDTSATEDYAELAQRSGQSRRGFFQSMSSSLKKLGVTVASTRLAALTSSGAHIPETLAEQLSAEPGKLLTFYPPRTTALLNLMYDVWERGGRKPLPSLTTRFWANMHISEACNNCGVCAVFCPTGALIHTGKLPQSPMLGGEHTPGPDHEFRCSDCIQCHLCADLCPNHAITLSPTLSADDLFALEPISITRTQ